MAGSVRFDHSYEISFLFFYISLPGSAPLLVSLSNFPTPFQTILRGEYLQGNITFPALL